jgi:hypothetical protein
MTDSSPTPQRRPARFWLGLSLTVSGSLALMICVVAFLNLEAANQGLLDQLMTPIGDDMIAAGIPSNVVSAAIAGRPPTGADLQDLTPYQQRKTANAIIVFGENLRMTDAVGRSARTSVIIGTCFALALAGAGFWLLRRRTKSPLT